MINNSQSLFRLGHFHQEIFLKSSLPKAPNLMSVSGLIKSFKFLQKQQIKQTNIPAYPFYLATGDKIFITCTHVFLCTLSVPINEIMIRYLKNKPPGKQTFLDRMLIDNHRLFQAINLTYHPFVIFATWGAHTHSIGGYFFAMTLAGIALIN